jgi:hypothetical protein
MARNKRIPLLLGLLGGGGIPYESITDDLSSDSGRWLDGSLASAALTIDTGRAVWAPTEEAQLQTTANATSDPNGNEANATTGWSGTQATLSVESSDVNTGTYALKVVANDGTDDRAVISRTSASRKWYVVRGAAKATIGTKWELREPYGLPGITKVAVGAGWANLVYTSKKVSDYSENTLWCGSGGSASDAALLDNYSMKELTPASQFRIQRIYYPSSVAVKAWMSGYTPLGVAVYKDADNWVLAVAHRSLAVFSVALLKSVAGAVSLVGSLVATTYSAGALLELIPAADFQTWTVKYNTATRINAAAITDFAATGTWYTGLFNTHNPSDITAVSFDDFAAARIAGASPFESAPAEAGATVALEATTVVRESLTEPDWFGRPSVKTLSDGTTVMVYYRGTGHAENAGAVHICFSDDYGETWTAEDTDLTSTAVAGFPMNPPDASAGEDANEPWLVRYDDDTLLLFIWRNDWSTSTFHGTYQSKSTDGGITWTTPAAVTITGARDSNLAFLTNDHFELAGRLYCAYEDAVSTIRCCLAYTDDKGANWTHLSVIATSTSEAALEYVGNDTIVSVLRASSNAQTFFNRSTNLGTSWTGRQELTWRIPPIIRPRIKTAAHLKGEANWWEDPHLILWGGYFDSNSKRVNCVSLSKDSGATWADPIELDDPYDDASYGDVLYNPNADTYEYLCYRGNGSAGPARIVQYSLRVDWGT